MSVPGLSADGRWLATGTNAGLVQIWAASSGELRGPPREARRAGQEGQIES